MLVHLTLLGHMG